ncbi:SPOR domain-containing protein [Candidatus Latescibacterota bacterium]
MGTTGFENEIDPFEFGDEFLHNQGQNIESDTSANSDRPDSDTQISGDLQSLNNENVLQPESKTQVKDNNTAVNGFGYRVQIGAFESSENANKLAESARSKIEYPVYVEYLPPLYRVRVGDFVQRSDAETCVESLKNNGFKDSRFVYTNINTH